MKTKKREQPDIYERDEHRQIIGEKPDARLKPGKHMGPQGQFGSPGSGYTLSADGGYTLAPCLTQSFNEFADEINAVNRLMQATQEYAIRRLKELEARRREWFSRAVANVYRPEDIMLATYDSNTGVLRFKNPEEAQAKEEK